MSLKTSTSFRLRVAAGDRTDRYIGLSREQLFVLMEDIIVEAAGAGIHVDFSCDPSGYETKAARDRLLLHIKEQQTNDWFCMTTTQVPVSAGGSWPDFDDWRRERGGKNKNQVDIT